MELATFSNGVNPITGQEYYKQGANGKKIENQRIGLRKETQGVDEEEFPHAALLSIFIFAQRVSADKSAPHSHSTK